MTAHLTKIGSGLMGLRITSSNQATFAEPELPVQQLLEK